MVEGFLFQVAHLLCSLITPCLGRQGVFPKDSLITLTELLSSLCRKNHG
jgi:hypothetical protein